MKKIIALILAAIMVMGLLAACGPAGSTESTGGAQGSNPPEGSTASDGTQGGEPQGGEPQGDTAYDYDAIPDTMTAEDGKYAIAFVTDVGQLKDKSFNQGTWEGVKRYATENNKSYKYYQPANGSSATDDDRFTAMKAAVDGGAEIVICAGFLQETALRRAALEYPETKFVFIDGYPIREEPDVDGQENTSPLLTNIAPISFQEEQAGYLVGYAAVKEGFTKLGFSGGGGGTNPACCRYGYGFVQGAQAAAAEMGVNVEMRYSWQYGAGFGASGELQTMLNGWYTAGTEVIYSCGGQMCQSAFAAAAANDGYVIGVDVDQAGDSDTVITSAMKGLRESVMFACEKFYAGEWDDLGGISTVLGAKDDAVGMPTAADSWRMENYTVAEYEALMAQLKDGSLVVDADYEAGLKDENFPNVSLSIE